MPSYVNQHFVPQFYFRRFSRGGKTINLILSESGRIISGASIRHQCAGRNFYGEPEHEVLFNRFESEHAHALRTLADAAWNANWFNFTEKELLGIWQAVLFQRSRTALQADKEQHVPTALALPAFRAHVAAKSDVERREKILEAIDRGEVSIHESREATLWRSMAIAMNAVLLISDLDICVLRNHTDYPFMFSDSPVVFYNSLLRNVTFRGVLGLQSPGLQIFYPLDSDTLLMLYDKTAYKVSGRYLLDVTNRSDVSQLNALQLHHSRHAVYFADPDSDEYVSNLWRAHANKLRRPTVVVRHLRDVVIDGKIELREVLQVMEPQLPLALNLSFVRCARVSEGEYRFHHRSPDLIAEHRQRTAMRKTASAATRE